MGEMLGSPTLCVLTLVLTVLVPKAGKENMAGMEMF